MSDQFYRPLIRQPTFHGRVSTDRTDSGFDNYLALTTSQYRMRIFLDGKERPAVTADPAAGIVETYQGDRKITLRGQVEIKLDSKQT